MNSSSLPKSTHIWSQCVCRLPNNFEIFSEWVLSVMVWLSKLAAAARLSVCFPLVLYLPHGQNMALAFNKTKLVLCVAMSASLELIIIIWNWKAATPSFSALTLITNKFSFRNLCVCVCVNNHICFPKLPLSTLLPVSSCFLSVPRLIFTVWSTSRFPSQS